MAELQTASYEEDVETERAPVTFPYTNTEIPQPAAGVIRGIGDWWGGLRTSLIHALPAFIVNSSSNLVGFLQIIAEALMFKSSGLNLWNPENRGKPLHLLTDPFENIYKGAFGKLKFKGHASDLLKPSTYVEGFRNFVDLERATKLDSAGGRLLTNNISALSSVTGMSAMTLATLLPDRKESAEETEQMVTMAHENPVGYAGMRLAQAVNPLSWWDNKRQIAGLGMTGAGFFSFLSGFRQVEGKEIGKQLYRRNGWQSMGGAITTVAGLQLLFAINNQQGWTSFGTTQLARVLTLGPSISSRFKPSASGGKEQGAEWYLGAQATMIAKNSTASLLGGAEKRPDGTIVDHNQMRVDAKGRAHAASKDTPVSTVRSVQRESALAEPLAAQMQ